MEKRPRDPRMMQPAPREELAAQQAARMQQMANAHNMVNQAGAQPGEEMQANETVGFVPVEQVLPKRMNKERLIKAMQDLTKYKSGKAKLESRIVEVEQWWKLRHWEWMQEKGAQDDIKTASAWLFNVIVSKHADGIQSIPEANILPREESDKPTAKMLSSIIPCVLEENKFESEYSAILWQKLKGGTGAYGVFWDKTKHNGLGDIAIRKVNLLRLFWEPGISNIQESKQVFLVEAVDTDILKDQYPELADENLMNKAVTVRKFMTEDAVDENDKTMVVDWYYHRHEGGKKVLHYCKFVGEHVLYCTEDDPELSGRGLYDHAMYPFVLDALFPVEGSPCGFGYVDVCKNAQEQIDIVNQAIVKNSLVNAIPRYFIRSDGSVNEEEFMDFTRPIVHVTGNLGADSVIPITPTRLDGTAINVVQTKISELKETSGNTDSSNGISAGQSQAASAIAALQEASGKVSRASTLSAYRAFEEVVNQVIELIRQFYDMPRQFRITGEMGEEQFASFDNAMMQPQHQGMIAGVDMGYRLPVFDIKVDAQSKTAYTKQAQNELALTLYNQGVFNPQMTDQALMLLDMMDFDGREKIMQKVSQNGTMMQMMAQYQQIALQLAQQVNPQLAEQLSQTIIGGAQATGGMPMGGGVQIGGKDPGGAAAKMENARERSQKSSQPRV